MIKALDMNARLRARDMIGKRARYREVIITGLGQMSQGGHGLRAFSWREASFDSSIVRGLNSVLSKKKGT